ncbi:glycosyltransferase family 4 protein [Brumimicrobium mesophilum]|uniref:glycosyltransferase family 4 protein n=1 Tax=Brumimicrobium mesophilum TaxID=392717 RepID=UPI000D1439E1|nr:glycosyltransferase family 4 protein [Brumimicrobium mesophilum]
MILHITNDYAGSTVYKNLISNLDEHGIEQIVYTPVKSESSIGGNLIELKEKNSKIIYSNILNMHVDRVLFNMKINKIYKDIQSKVDFSKIKNIHAHTWFSDGAVALKLHKKYNITYMIAVRGSDLNQFWKLPHLKKQGLEILKNASKIVLITPTYQKRLLNLNKVKILGEDIKSKTVVIPNGLDPYWLAHVKPKNLDCGQPVKLLYIGVFSEAKNVLNLLKAVEELVKQGVDCQLDLVGGGGPLEKQILNFIENKSYFKFHGKVYDKLKLENFFQKSSIYVMTSIRETFGLVYGEALSQGIPVIYSQNEGIDGVFKDKIGVAVNPRSIPSIVEGIKKVIDSYDQFDYEPKKIVKKLDWNKIALKYVNVYNGIESNRNN